MHHGHAYRRKITITFLLLAIVPLTILYCLYALASWNAHKSRVVSAYDALLARDAMNLNDLLTNGVRRLTMVDRNIEIQNYLSSTRPPSIMESVELFHRLNLFFLSLSLDSAEWRFQLFTPRDDILLVFPIRHIAELDPDIRTRIDSLPAGSILVAYRLLRGDGSSGGSLSLCKKNVSVDGSLSSIVEVRLGLSLLEDAVRPMDLPAGGFAVYSIGADTSIVLGTEPPPGGPPADAEELVRAANASSRYYRLEKGVHESFAVPGRLTMFLPRSYVFREGSGLLLSLAGLYAAVVGVMIGGFFLTSRMLTARLYDLLHDIDRDVDRIVQDDTVHAGTAHDEFFRIAGKFQELIQRVKRYYEELARAELARKELELDLLQDLMNPHFLYNTLDGIKWHARDETVVKVVDSLVRYYRIALNKGRKTLPVSRELDMIVDYLDLERFAYESGFSYEIDASDEARRCTILKHLLQPVVENSILHGIRKQGSDGRIRIRAECRDGVLRLRVEDNGAGMDDKKLALVLTNGHAGSKGYGLFNVQQRIWMYYGDGFGLSIESRPGAGTTVEIVIPAVQEGEDAPSP